MNMINSKKAREYIDGFAQTREYFPPFVTGTECAFCKFFNQKTSRCRVRFFPEYTDSWRTCNSFVEEDYDKFYCVAFKEKDVVQAVEIAEAEARERFIEALKSIKISDIDAPTFTHTKQFREHFDYIKSEFLRIIDNFNTN